MDDRTTSTERPGADVDSAGLSRRRFVQLSILGGAGLTIGCSLRAGDSRTRLRWEAPVESWIPDAWIRIDPDGTVTVRVHHSEMGQGVATGLPTVVAEELGVAWEQVRFEMAPVADVYKNPMMMTQATGGSTSLTTSWEILRAAGAAAREMLVRAAAESWEVPVEGCRTENGRVLHEASGRSAGYGELATLAARLEPVGDVVLEDPARFSLVGKELPRLDVEEKVTGQAVFGIDVDLPGMLVATVVHPPRFGDRARNVDSRKARALARFRRVEVIDGGVAVVADTFWQAHRAARALEITWEGQGQRSWSSAALWKHWEKLAAGSEARELASEGDVEAGLDRAGRVVEATYRMPYQAHATQEPMNCTAHVEEGHARVWVPTQGQGPTIETVSRRTGLPYDRIEVITTYLGGGFGRRGEVDFVDEAIQLSQRLQRPVKVIWSREEDMAHDTYRPASLHRLRAGLDKEGRLVAWLHPTSCPTSR